MFKTVIEFYGRTLTWVLRSANRHALGRRRDAGVHGAALRLYPEGLFPGAGYRRDTRHFRSAASGLFHRHGGAPTSRWPASFCKDPAVESLSSFIGVDGTNTTLNSGRILVNLKPIAVRKISASDVIRRLQPQLAKVDGHRAFHAAGAGSDGGRSGEPDAISIQSGKSRSERA